MADIQPAATNLPAPAVSPAGTIVAPGADDKPAIKDEVKAGKDLQKKGAKVAKPDDEQKAGTKMPSIGEFVHYVSPFPGSKGKHRPMVVTSIATPPRAGVNGHVLMEPGDGIGDTHYFAQDIAYSPDKLIGTWHYAETDESESHN